MNWRASLASMVALIVPLLLWGAGLAWYNYARFGNILETGHRFQLTGGALPANYNDIVSISYILPNLYNFGTTVRDPLARISFLLHPVDPK